MAQSQYTVDPKTRQLIDASGKPVYIFKNGQKLPAYSAGTLNDLDMPFIGLDDLMQVFMGNGQRTEPPAGAPTLPNNLMQVLDALGSPVLPPSMASPQTVNGPAPTPPMAPQPFLPPNIRYPMASAPVVPDPMAGGASSPGGAGPWDMAPSMGQMQSNSPGIWDQFVGAMAPSVDKYGKTWQDPEAATQFPFSRSKDNTGLQNTAAGFGNVALSSPQMLWHLYNNYIGKPVGGVLSSAANNIFDWATKPETQVDAEKAPPPNPMAGFVPGLPQVGEGTGAPAGGASSTTKKIIGAESGGNPTATNSNSSAFGPGQFIKSTWMDFIKEVHPEMAGKPEAEVLKLRSDPNLSTEATSWYAGKAVDVLDEINAPATDANIYLHHFLGPEGVKNLLQADPTALASSVLDAKSVAANKTILGGSATVQDVIDWANAKMGDLTTPKPIPRPETQMPDFSGMLNWLEQATPKPMDEQTLKNLQFQMFLSGIGGGLASVNAEEEGGGALMSALAAGVTKGGADSQEFGAQVLADYNDRMEKFAGARAEVEGGIAQTKAEVANKNAEGSWLNSVDQQNYLVQQNAEQKALEEKLKAAGTSKVLNATDKGITIQHPDGSVEFQSFENSDMFKQVEQLGKIYGNDSALVRQAKYSTMVQSGTNLITFQAEVIRDLITDGMGPAVWGDGYIEAQKVAEESLPQGVAPGTKEYQDAIEKSMVGLLLGASQSMGNYDWVLQAASLGNPGAQLLVQGGKKP